MRLIPSLFIAGTIGLAACSPPENAVAVPDTNATAPDGTRPAEPGVGSPPETGGGVPGSSLQSDDAANPDGTAADPPLPRETPAA